MRNMMSYENNATSSFDSKPHHSITLSPRPTNIVVKMGTCPSCIPEGSPKKFQQNDANNGNGLDAETKVGKTISVTEDGEEQESELDDNHYQLAHLSNSVQKKPSTSDNTLDDFHSVALNSATSSVQSSPARRKKGSTVQPKNSNNNNISKGRSTSPSPLKKLRNNNSTSLFGLTSTQKLQYRGVRDGPADNFTIHNSNAITKVRKPDRPESDYTHDVTIDLNGLIVKDALQIVTSSIHFYSSKQKNKLDHLTKKVNIHYIVEPSAVIHKPTAIALKRSNSSNSLNGLSSSGSNANRSRSSSLSRANSRSGTPEKTRSTTPEKIAANNRVVLQEYLQQTPAAPLDSIRNGRKESPVKTSASISLMPTTPTEISEANKLSLSPAKNITCSPSDASPGTLRKIKSTGSFGESPRQEGFLKRVKSALGFGTTDFLHIDATATEGENSPRLLRTSDSGNNNNSSGKTTNSDSSDSGAENVSNTVTANHSSASVPNTEVKYITPVKPIPVSSPIITSKSNSRSTTPSRPRALSGSTLKDFHSHTIDFSATGRSMDGSGDVVMPLVPGTLGWSLFEYLQEKGQNAKVGNGTLSVIVTPK